MAGSMMRSPIEQIRNLSDSLNNPNSSVRLRAINRIFNIGEAAGQGSRIRQVAIDALVRGYQNEQNVDIRDRIRTALNSLGFEIQEEQRELNEVVPSRSETRSTARDATTVSTWHAISRTVQRSATSAILQGIVPIAILSSLSGCSSTWDYEDSVMYGETHLVREYTENLTRDCETDWERVMTIVHWGQANLPHYSSEYTAEIYQTEVTERGAANPMDVSIRDVFRERVVGCHLAVFTIATMLRSVGIDAEYVRSNDLGIGERGHGLLYIPQFEQYVHGDRILNLFPTEDIFESQDELGTRSYAGNAYSVGFLRRDGEYLFIDDGVIRAGHEESELLRLQQAFPEYNLQLSDPHPSGVGTTFVSGRIRIETLD